MQVPSVEDLVPSSSGLGYALPSTGSTSAVARRKNLRLMARWVEQEEVMDIHHPEVAMEDHRLAPMANKGGSEQCDRAGGNAWQGADLIVPAMSCLRPVLPYLSLD